MKKSTERETERGGVGGNLVCAKSEAGGVGVCVSTVYEKKT